MVYGQELDLKYEALGGHRRTAASDPPQQDGALINAAVQMGAAAAGATPQQCRELEDYAYGMGLVFQIVDDVLDVTGTPEQLGKPIGSDSENGKTTFVTLYGADGAMELAQKLNEQICASAPTAVRGEERVFGGAGQGASGPAQLRKYTRRWTKHAIDQRSVLGKRDPDRIASGLVCSPGAQDDHQFYPARQISAGADVGRRRYAQRTQRDRLCNGHRNGTQCGSRLLIFAVASVVAIITMHDAMGVRHETGEQAKVLNQMIEQWIESARKMLPFAEHAPEGDGRPYAAAGGGRRSGRCLRWAPLPDEPGVRIHAKEKCRRTWSYGIFPLLDKISQPSDLKKLSNEQVESAVRGDPAFYAGTHLQNGRASRL